MNHFNEHIVNPPGMIDYATGLRSFMVRVYNYMALALILSGLVAYWISANLETVSFLFTPVVYLGLIFSSIGIAVFLGARIHKLSIVTAHILYWSYAALSGVSLTTVFLIYTNQSVVYTFYIAAAMFAVAGLFGYMTKINLGPIGTFLYMALFGVIIAIIANLFIGSSQMQLYISVFGVIIFAGLTAYDHQKLKEVYNAVWQDNSGQLEKIAIMGAFHLYLDFINLFRFLLYLVGERRRD